MNRAIPNMLYNAPNPMAPKTRPPPQHNDPIRPTNRPPTIGALSRPAALRSLEASETLISLLPSIALGRSALRRGGIAGFGGRCDKRRHGGLGFIERHHRRLVFVG